MLSAEIKKGNEYIGPSLGAIVLCTSSESHKFQGMKRLLSTGPYTALPIGSAAAHTIPEVTYNAALSYRPDLVAAVKSIQIARRPLEPLLAGIFPDKPSIVGLPVVFVSNDVMFDLRDKKGNWKPFQKPTTASTHDDFARIYRQYLGGLQYCCGDRIEARFRCGAAAAVVNPDGSRRGIAGVIEMFFWFDKFSDEEITHYLYTMSPENLHTSNFGLRWEHEDLASHIKQIDFTDSEAPDFSSQREYFTNLTKGALPGINNLIESAHKFSRARALGSITHEVDRLAKDLLSPQEQVGVWGTWHTNRILG